MTRTSNAEPKLAIITPEVAFCEAVCVAPADVRNRVGSADHPTTGGPIGTKETGTNRAGPVNSAVSVKVTVLRLATPATLKAGHSTVPPPLMLSPLSVKGNGVQSEVIIEAFATMTRTCSEKTKTSLRNLEPPNVLKDWSMNPVDRSSRFSFSIAVWVGTPLAASPGGVCTSQHADTMPF